MMIHLTINAASYASSSCTWALVELLMMWVLGTTVREARGSRYVSVSELDYEKTDLFRRTGETMLHHYRRWVINNTAKLRGRREATATICRAHH